MIIQASLTQTSQKNKVKWRCYFNGRWKDTCDQIRVANNQKKAYFTEWGKEFGFRHVKGMWKCIGGLTLLISMFLNQSINQYGPVSKSIKIFCLPKRHRYSVKHSSHCTNRHTLSYHSLVGLMRLSEVTFPKSEVTICSMGEQKEFWQHICWPLGCRADLPRSY